MYFLEFLLLLSILATKGLAFVSANYVLEELQGFEKKLSSDMDLSARMISGQVLTFEAEQNVVNPKIPDLAKRLGLSTLVGLLAKADLTELLYETGPFTMFGPTNEAFSNLPDWSQDILTNKTTLTNVLMYHVVLASFPSTFFKDELLLNTGLKNKKLRINMYSDTSPNGVIVMTAQCASIDLKRVNSKAFNGLIHVVNSVMIPPMGNIVECILKCPVFKTLVTALKATTLMQILSGGGPFTLFAPTDKAFNKLPPDYLDKLLMNTTALQLVLEYHVVHLTYCKAGLLTGLYSEITTLSEQNIIIQVSAEEVKVNDANIIVSDGSVSNGVLHAIDTVLIPPIMKK